MSKLVNDKPGTGLDARLKSLPVRGGRIFGNSPLDREPSSATPKDSKEGCELDRRPSKRSGTPKGGLGS